METLNYAQILISALFGKGFSPTKTKPEKNLQVSSMTRSQNYLTTREQYVKKLEEIGLALNTLKSTLHLAVSLFDELNLKNSHSAEEKEKLLLICMSLSIKFNEDLLEISNKDLQDYNPNLSVKEILKLELKVLEVVDWKLARKTTASIIQETCLSLFSHSEKVLNYSMTLADLSLRMKESVSEDQQTIACTCIALTLKKLGLTNFWTSQLEKKTGVLKEKLKIEELEKKFKETLKKC